LTADANTSNPPQTWQQRRLRLSFVTSRVAGLIGLGFGVYNTQGTDPVPFVNADSSRSIAVILILLTLLDGMFVTVLGYRQLVAYDESLSPIERAAAAVQRNLIGRISVAVTVGLLLMGLSVVGTYLFDLIFAGVALTRFSVILLAGAYSAVLAFWIAYWVVTLKSQQIFGLAVAVIVVGMAVAAVTSTNTRWWQNSLSFLGHDDNAAMFFNIGLILGGMLLLAVAVDVINEFRVLKDKGRFPDQNYRLLQIMLCTICFCVSGIGMFPSSVSLASDILHQIAANGMVALIVILMFTVTAVVPVLSIDFKATSRIFGALCVLFVLLALIRVFNFVTLEITLIGACLTWMFLFKREVKNYIRIQPALAPPPIPAPLPPDSTPLIGQSEQVSLVGHTSNPVEASPVQSDTPSAP